MNTKLIIIRGNSGCGKSTIAKELQHRLNGSLLLSQDVIRREMLNVRDTKDNLAIDLIKQIALYGDTRVPYVILEGILSRKIYQVMLYELQAYFAKRTFTCYFDLTFKETLARHNTKPNSNEFGEKELRRWWNEKDYLGCEGEVCFHDHHSFIEIITRIVKAISVLGD